MRGNGLSARVFAILGIVSIAVGVALAVLGSFAYLAALAVGLFFIAAALIVRRTRTGPERAAGMLILAGVALGAFGLTATPLLFAAVGLIAAGVVVLILAGGS